MTAEMCARLPALPAAGGAGHDRVPMQGSGISAVEAVLGSLIAPGAGAILAVGRKRLIDSVSVFAALKLDPTRPAREALVSSTSDSIEGVPGFGFVLARCEAIAGSRSNAHSRSLDLHAQWDCIERTGQWRLAPPTRGVAANLEARRTHEAEGSASAAPREARSDRARHATCQGTPEESRR